MPARRPPVASTVAALGGVATRAQLRRRGYTGHNLTRAVRTGSLLRVRRAWYACPDVDLPTRIAISLGGRLGGLSAAATFEWWTGLDTDIHVSWPAHGNVAKPGRVRFEYPIARTAGRAVIRQHWQPTPAGPDDWREPATIVLAQVLLTADRATAIACADSAIKSGRLSRTDVAFVFASLPRKQRRWERLLGRADSGLETIVRIWLIDHGIPFRTHVEIDGVGEVDFVVGDSLVIETDGRKFHDSIKHAGRDAVRDNELSARGYLVIRWRYAMVMFAWADCVRRLREHLSRGDHLRPVA